MLKKKCLLSISLFLITTMLFLFFPAGKAGALMLELSMEELTAEADSVVVGTVKTAYSQWNDEQTAIYTKVIVSLENSLKGASSSQNITIIIPGGKIDGITQIVSDTPAFEPGEQVILFLEDLPRQVEARHWYRPWQYGVFGNFQGKIEIVDNTVEGVPVEEVEELILQIVEEGQSENALDPKDGETTLVSNYQYTPLGIRWPDSSPVVEYQINATEDRNIHIQAAADTWTAAGANFSFHYSGPHSRNGTASLNEVNEIMWADLGTNSALALATIWLSGSTILETDMVMNTRFGWTTDPGGYHDVQTAALHEFGHWIGLDHSPVYESIMYYQYKGTQRTLAHDDIAGIRYIYGTAGNIVTPGNDNFADRISLSGLAGQGDGNNLNATLEPGEPLHADLFGGASTWWEWTAPESGNITFDTFNSNFDTIIAVYTGTSLSGLTAIASNDDYGETRQSRVDFNATAETTYKIAVDGWNGSTGTIILNWQLTPIPAEDTEDSPDPEPGVDSDEDVSESEEINDNDANETDNPDQIDDSNNTDDSIENNNDDETSGQGDDKSEEDDDDELEDNQDNTQSDPEIITVPQPPTGPVAGYVNSFYTYSTAFLTCADGTATQYQFDWGDNTASGWIDTIQAVQSWPVAGIYQVRVRARSININELISEWSEALIVNIEEVPAPAPTPAPEPAPSPVPPASAPVPVQYTLTIAVSGEGTTNPVPGSASYNENAEIELTAKPSDGWRFKKWIINGSEVKSASTRLKITGNISATAYYTAVSKGDLTGDGSINVSDVALVARYALGLTTLTGPQITSADVNSDGVVDVRDTVLIMRFALGLINNLPSN
jgi:hypothetical protein